jgi:Fur family transcriptional regulator, ferric uptake regulator
MNVLKDTHDCRSELREADLKATPARLALLKLLEEAEKPLDVAAMITYLQEQKIPTDQATVFRIMNTFTEKGLTKQISFNEGKFRYELASKADHHHLICEQCGAIEDFSDCNIWELEADIKRKKKFFVRRHSLEFFGVCKQCQH